jgi:hypothetical protein
MDGITTVGDEDGQPYVVIAKDKWDAWLLESCQIREALWHMVRTFEAADMAAKSLEDLAAQRNEAYYKAKRLLIGRGEADPAQGQAESDRPRT